MLLLLACHAPDADLPDAPPGSVAVEDLTAGLAAIETVVRVRWRTEEPTFGTVTASAPDVVPVEIVEEEATTEHDVVLAGFPARTALSVTVRVATEAGESGVGETTLTTGVLPSWVPDVTYTADAPEAGAGGFTVTSVIGTTGGNVVVYDRLGRPVWAHRRVEDTPSSITRARLSLDGTAILYNRIAPGVDAAGLIVRVPLDGSASTEREVTGAHVDFVELPTGGYAALGWELRQYGDRAIVGDTLVEVDPTGEARVVWSAFDDFVPDLSVVYDNLIPESPELEDWTHINSLTYDPLSDAYFVTITSHDAVARIDRSGAGLRAELAWWVSDDGGDFTPVGDTRLLSRPHSAQPTEAGLVVFNRGDPSDPSTCSAAVDIALDDEAGTARATWAHTSERCLLIGYLGSAQRLEGGNTLVSWSTAGQLDEVTPDGALAWRVSTGVGTGFGFAERVPVLGPLPPGL